MSLLLFPTVDHSYTVLSLIKIGVSAYFCFFFSSRRRHTRFSRDWRDVCSSDLTFTLARTRGVPTAAAVTVPAIEPSCTAGPGGRLTNVARPSGVNTTSTPTSSSTSVSAAARAEERRAGKARGRRGGPRE